MSQVIPLLKTNQSIPTSHSLKWNLASLFSWTLHIIISSYFSFQLNDSDFLIFKKNFIGTYWVFAFYQNLTKSWFVYPCFIFYSCQIISQFHSYNFATHIISKLNFNSFLIFIVLILFLLSNELNNFISRYLKRLEFLLSQLSHPQFRG